MIKKFSLAGSFVLLLLFVWWLSWDLKKCRDENLTLFLELESTSTLLKAQNKAVERLNELSQAQLYKYSELQLQSERQRFKLEFLELKSDEFEDILKILDSVKLGD